MLERAIAFLSNEKETYNLGKKRKMSESKLNWNNIWQYQDHGTTKMSGYDFDYSTLNSV